MISMHAVTGPCCPQNCPCSWNQSCCKNRQQNAYYYTLITVLREFSISPYTVHFTYIVFT